MPKFKNYPELTVLAPDDAILVVDTDDTTDAADGSTKYVQAKNFAPVGRVIREELVRVDNTAVASTFDFGTFDATGYDRLIVHGYARGTSATFETSTRCFMNGDYTEANYSIQQVAGTDGSSSDTKGVVPYVGPFPGASAPTNSYGMIHIRIEAPNGPQLKMMHSVTDAYTGSPDTLSQRNIAVVAKNVSAPVTALDLRTNNHPTDGFFGMLILYGERTIE